MQPTMSAEQITGPVEELMILSVLVSLLVVLAYFMWTSARTNRQADENTRKMARLAWLRSRERFPDN
jgi:regulatory protein YycH of two-component signal transduction system YycFG